MLADGERIEDSEELWAFQNDLEYFLLEILAEDDPTRWWRGEALDGFRFGLARKTRPREAEFLGLCLLISDQAWTPIHVQLRVEQYRDAIEWVRCRIGDGGGDPQRMTRLPYESSKANKLLFAVSEHPDRIEWTFHVERGVSRPS